MSRNRVQVIRSNAALARPSPGTRESGELFLNFPDRQLGFIDPSQNPIDLLVSRFFSASTSYVAGQYVSNNGIMYRARGSVAAGPFNAAQWDKVIDQGSAGSLTTGVYISDNPPSNPYPGQLWWESDSGNTFVWYADANSQQWVQINILPSYTPTVFANRDDMKTRIAGGFPLKPGALYIAPPLNYIAVPGATAIPDLPGLLPYGDVNVEHFGAKADMMARLWLLGRVNYSTLSTYGPYRFAGTDSYAAFKAADDYVVDVLKATSYFAEGGFLDPAPGDNYLETYNGYYIGQQIVLRGKLRSRREFKNYIWLYNNDVHKANIWLNTDNAGVTGLSLIGQYAYPTNVGKASGQGISGPIISCLMKTASSVGGKEYPRLYTPERQPILRGLEVDVRTCRAGATISTTNGGTGSPPNGLGGQTSRGAYHLGVWSGIEGSKFTILPFGQCNVGSNGLCLAHYGCWTNDVDPWLNWAGVVLKEQYVCADSEFYFPGHIDAIKEPHGFQGVFFTAGSGAFTVGDISCRGLQAFVLTPGDPGNAFCNPLQKDKVLKGIEMGYVTVIDCPLTNGHWDETAGKYVADLYGVPQNAVVKISGLGTSQHPFDKYPGTNRQRTRQVEVAVKCKGFYIGRHLSTAGPTEPPVYFSEEAWNGRALYVVGCPGTVDLGAITTWGFGRGYEIEYSDGIQELNYVEGDGTLMYEFSRGGKLISTATERGQEFLDSRFGVYRKGLGANTRAVSIAGKTYSTEVALAPGTVHPRGATRTPIVPFGEIDDDDVPDTPNTPFGPVAQPVVYVGTPILIGGHEVTSTDNIPGRSPFNYEAEQLIAGSPPEVYVSVLDACRMENGQAISIYNNTAVNGVKPANPVLMGTGTIANLDMGTGAHLLLGAVRGWFQIVGFTYAGPVFTDALIKSVLAGVNYIDHTPLPADIVMPAAPGAVPVVVDETIRIKELNVNSGGGESGVKASKASIDGVTTYGLRWSGSYGLNLVETRVSTRGPMGLTVGRTDPVAPIGQPGHVARYTVRGDANSLVSAVDSTIRKNPDVDAHFFMEKVVGGGAGGGHVDLRNCRIEDIGTILLGSPGTLRFILSMSACTDIADNRLMSHPGRQGKDEENGKVGGRGNYHYADDGMLSLWLRNAVTVLTETSPGVWDFLYNWIFPGNFVGNGEYPVVTAQLISNALSPLRKECVVTTGSSTGCTIKFFNTDRITNITKAANAVFTVSGGHRISNGTVVTISDVAGMVEMNGKTGPVTVVDGQSFTIGINSTAFSTYAYGGIISEQTGFNADAVGRWYAE